MTKRKSKGAYMISAVAQMYCIHPQTLRLYEREGLLKRSRTEGNTRLYTDEDLLRLEFILSLARDLGVNISGMAIILQMRERMKEMQRQIQEFVQYIQQDVLTRANAAADPAKGAIVPVRRAMGVPAVQPGQKREACSTIFDFVVLSELAGSRSEAATQLRAPPELAEGIPTFTSASSARTALRQLCHSYRDASTA